jgi:uncharacterized tellurite resistance protein B-like protein
VHEQDIAIIKGLVPVAWADGVFAQREREMLDALLDAYNASDREKESLREYASHQKTLDDIDPQDLSADDRRILLQHAVLLSFADGEQSKDESTLLQALAKRLHIPDQEAKNIVAAGAARAKKLFHLIG